MPPLDAIHLVLHTHTDIGFTHDQPVVWDLHERFLDEALDQAQADLDADTPEAEAFKWTCECWLPVRRWWRHASAARRRQFRELEAAGRIEVTAMPLHLAPLYDQTLLAEAFRQLEAFRTETGLTVRTAMNCDVNGQHWFMADALLDAGVVGYSVAINTHFGTAPLDRPQLFHWEAPSGRTLPAHNGFTYGFGNRFAGLTAETAAQEADDFLPKLAERLEASGWTLPVLMIQAVHAFGDNGSAPVGMQAGVRAWNALGRGPRLRISTMSQYWDAVRQQDGFNALPTHGGDWTDSWNFGAGSAAREATVARRAQVRLETADAVRRHVPPGSDARFETTWQRYRDVAWEHLLVWTEHTWGADCGISEPHHEDTASCWAHKAHLAYQARSLSQMLRRDALAALARQADATAGDAFVLYNPLGWERTIAGLVPATLSPQPRGGREDDTAGRLYAERRSDWHPFQSVGLSGAWLDQLPQYALRPTRVPAHGVVTLPRSALYKIADAAERIETTTLANEHLTVALDPVYGGIRQMGTIDGYAWTTDDGEAHAPLHRWIREGIDTAKASAERSTMFSMDWDSPTLLHPDGWKHDWPAAYEEAGPCRQTEVTRLPDGLYAKQEVALPGDRGTLELFYFLPVAEPWIECEARWPQGLETAPEATYLSYTFALENATVRYDLGGMAIDPARQQLPGVTTDFASIGRWVDFHNGERGVTIATPDNPLAQLGGFRFGRGQRPFRLEAPRFLGWVTNNYWETNFRAHQPGPVTARYRLFPYTGAYEEAACHRRGAEAAFSAPEVHPLIR